MLIIIYEAHYNTLQIIASHCNGLQQTARNLIFSIHWNTLHVCIFIHVNKARAHHRLCNTLQNTTSYCNTTLQHNTRNLIRTTHCDTLRVCMYGETACASVPLQHTATHCNTLQHTATRCAYVYMKNLHAYPYLCNTLQHTATHCNTLQHTARMYI